MMDVESIVTILFSIVYLSLDIFRIGFHHFKKMVIPANRIFMLAFSIIDIIFYSKNRRNNSNIDNIIVWIITKYKIETGFCVWSNVKGQVVV